MQEVSYVALLDDPLRRSNLNPGHLHMKTPTGLAEIEAMFGDQHADGFNFRKLTGGQKLSLHA